MWTWIGAGHLYRTENNLNGGQAFLMNELYEGGELEKSAGDSGAVGNGDGDAGGDTETDADTEGVWSTWKSLRNIHMMNPQFWAAS